MPGTSRSFRVRAIRKPTTRISGRRRSGKRPNPERIANTGWVGRFLDAAELPQNNLFNAVAVAPVLPEMMIARNVDVPAIAG
jgi:hypothetical protein